MYISLLLFHGKIAFAMISKYNFLISMKLVCVKTFCAVFAINWNATLFDFINLFAFNFFQIIHSPLQTDVVFIRSKKILQQTLFSCQ